MTYRTVRDQLAEQRSAEIREDGIAKLKAIRESIPCPSCADAEVNPLSGHFSANCKECSARAIAGGPDFYEVSKARAVTPEYARLMKNVFGEEWKSSHERVKAWAQRMAEARVIL